MGFFKSRTESVLVPVPSDSLRHTLVINNGRDREYQEYSLPQKEFIQEIRQRIRRPEKIFLGMGNFLEMGDFSSLIDSVFYEREKIPFDEILDKNNRRLSTDGDIPFSFFKLGVYFPDFLLKDVPVPLVSEIGRQSRLFPGARDFIAQIQRYDPQILTAIPQEIAVEFMKRIGLAEKNLVATEYRIEKNNLGIPVFAGNVDKYISGDRRSIIIERYLHDNNLNDKDVLYIGKGEAGYKTFRAINSIAFNPGSSLMEEASITIYGSTLEALLVLFNYEGELDEMLCSDGFAQSLPSLVVFSEERGKAPELLAMEEAHLRMQNNIIGQRIEYSGESYRTVERDIHISFGGSMIDIKKVRKMVQKRMDAYLATPQNLVKEVYRVARERYKKQYSVNNEPG